MTKDEEKRRAAERAIAYVEEGSVVGVGTGSTVAHFIDALARIKDRIEGAVSSSEQSTRQLRGHGIAVLDLNATGDLGVYIDGADECDPHKRPIKGGGAALTREKIIAGYGLPIEVIPMARSHVAREIVKRGGQPVWRDGVTTDNGNWILDVHNLSIVDPVGLEREFNQIVGVVTVGLFAARPADIVLCGDQTL